MGFLKLFSSTQHVNFIGESTDYCMFKSSVQLLPHDAAAHEEPWPLHSSQSCATLRHLLTPNLLKSSSTSSTNLLLGLPLALLPPGPPTNAFFTALSFVTLCK